MNKILKIQEKILNLIYPQTCGICGKITPNALCKKCEINLNKQSENQIIKEGTEIEDKYFNELMYIFRYEGKIRKIIIDYKFNEESAYYYRFITHLKFFAQRLVEHKKQNKQEDDLLEVVQVKYANAYQCVEKIAMYIKNQYNYELYDEEKLYLTIHIHRVVYLGNSH